MPVVICKLTISTLAEGSPEWRNELVKKGIPTTGIEPNKTDTFKKKDELYYTTAHHHGRTLQRRTAYISQNNDKNITDVVVYTAKGVGNSEFILPDGRPLSAMMNETYPISLYLIRFLNTRNEYNNWILNGTAFRDFGLLAQCGHLDLMSIHLIGHGLPGRYALGFARDVHDSEPAPIDEIGAYIRGALILHNFGVSKNQPPIYGTLKVRLIVCYAATGVTDNAILTLNESMVHHLGKILYDNNSDHDVELIHCKITGGVFPVIGSHKPGGLISCLDWTYKLDEELHALCNKINIPGSDTASMGYNPTKAIELFRIINDWKDRGHISVEYTPGLNLFEVFYHPKNGVRDKMQEITEELYYLQYHNDVLNFFWGTINHTINFEINYNKDQRALVELFNIIFICITVIEKNPEMLEIAGDIHRTLGTARVVFEKLKNKIGQIQVPKKSSFYFVANFVDFAKNAEERCFDFWKKYAPK